MSPTQRSIAHLKAAGYVVGKVEHYNAAIRCLQDLWGFADLIAARKGVPIMLVQTTTAANASARRKKILRNPIARIWVVECGQEIVLHGWALRGKRGARKAWEVEPEWITADQFHGDTA